MRSLLGSLWQRMFQRQDGGSGYLLLRLETEMLRMLAELASEEQRPADEVAASLLTYALIQRKMAGEYLAVWRSLTPREQEVAALASAGSTNREIAERLVISDQTVKSHMYSILRKFEFTRKNELSRVLSLWDFSSWSHHKETETEEEDPGE
jgi:DNA-binding NarL/FixJ family response regulator